MQDKKLDSLQKLNFFKSLDSQQLDEVKKISKIVEYPKNSILYYENDTYDKIFFLVRGVLKVYKIDKYENEIFLYHIQSNSLISELTSLDNTHINCYSNSEFIEDSLILEVDFSELKEKFLKKNILNNEFIN